MALACLLFVLNMIDGGLRGCGRASLVGTDALRSGAPSRNIQNEVEDVLLTPWV